MRDSTSMINLGVIGLGNVGQFETDICKNKSDVTLVAGADIASDARERYQKAFSVPVYEKYEEMLADHKIDAVIVTTPHTHHYEPVRVCLKHDINVFVEKPMATNIQKAVNLVDIADERQRVLQVGYQRHFHPAYQEIKQLIEKGKIGQIHTMNCHLSQNWIEQVDNTWRVEKSLSGGGQLYDSGSHLIDALLWITNATPQTVASSIDYRDHEVDINSAIAATLNRDGHSIMANICITGDGISTGRPKEGIQIWGTEGQLRYENRSLYVCDKNEGRKTPREIEIDPIPSVQDITDRELTDFFGAVRGKHESTVPGTIGIAVTAMTEAIYRSNETGQRINVESMLEQHQ